MSKTPKMIALHALEAIAHAASLEGFETPATLEDCRAVAQQALDEINKQGEPKCFVNPTISGLVARAEAINAMLSDDSGQMGLRDALRLMNEYDHCIAPSMKAITAGEITPHNLWEHYCDGHRLATTHCAADLPDHK
jgi:hypothetical protein